MRRAFPACQQNIKKKSVVAGIRIELWSLGIEHSPLTTAAHVGLYCIKNLMSYIKTIAMHEQLTSFVKR
jgi:hypothetical protein